MTFEQILFILFAGLALLLTMLKQRDLERIPTDEPLRLCPERWLGKATHRDLRASLRPLLDLPVAPKILGRARRE